MAQDTLILLCKTLNDAIMASNQIERRHDLNRLFIFLGKKPQDKDLKWMSNSDASFCLERTLEWSNNPELIGVRAGLMFATGWDLIFCWADNCPSDEDIHWIRNDMKSAGLSKLSNVWGITRDHYILHGLGEESVFQTTFQTAKEIETNNIDLGLNIANALAGLKVNSETAIAALKEIAHLSPLYVHESISQLDEQGGKIASLIINSAEYLENDVPVSVLISESCSESAVIDLRDMIANHGTVISLSKQPPEYTFKPYRTILIDNDYKINLYGK